jgi:hypothetical protein
LVDYLFHHELNAVESKLMLERTEQRNARTRPGLRNRHLPVTHALQDVAEVLAITINEDAAIIAKVLRVAAAEVGVEECMRDTTKRLNGGLEPVATDIERGVPFLCLLVLVRGFNFSMQLPTPCFDIVEPLGVLCSDLGEALHALLSKLGNRNLESCSGSCHEALDSGVEGSIKLLLQVVQERVKYRAREACNQNRWEFDRAVDSAKAVDVQKEEMRIVGAGRHPQCNKY